jgi:hypothetical protein
MHLETSSKAARRQIANDFKDRRVSRGIFAVRCAATEQVWVGSSPNLDSARNSLWFQLRIGQCRNADLQSAWKQHGEPAFTLEVVEQFDDEVSPLLINDMYVARKKQWSQTLTARPL